VLVSLLPLLIVLPVVPDGYGLSCAFILPLLHPSQTFSLTCRAPFLHLPSRSRRADSVGDDFLRWVITCQKPQKAEQLKENLRWACDEVKAMFERGEQPKAKL
jgi:hypothetical protein